MFKTFLIAIVLVIIVGSFLSWSGRNNAPPSEAPVATSSNAITVTLTDDMIVVALGETGTQNDVSVTPTELLGDSRCPQDVECVWAGTVEVVATLESGLGTSTNTFEVGTTITTEAESITLIEVAPYPVSGAPAQTSEYRFVFEVKKR